MKATQQSSSAKSATTPKTKAKTKAKAKPEKAIDPLATCPVNGAGWCPYPFSVAQLKKRLKAKAQQS